MFVNNVESPGKIFTSSTRRYLFSKTFLCKGSLLTATAFCAFVCVADAKRNKNRGCLILKSYDGRNNLPNKPAGTDILKCKWLN